MRLEPAEHPGQKTLRSGCPSARDAGRATLWGSARAPDVAGIGELLCIGRERHFCAVHLAGLVRTAREDRLYRAAVLSDEPTQVAVAVSRREHPEGSFAEELIDTP